MCMQQMRRPEGLMILIVVLSLFLTMPLPLYAQVKNDPPSHSSGHLIIPSVRDVGQSVLYRNAYLTYDESIDRWRLTHVEAIPLDQDRIKEVKLIVTESLPIQVFLQLIGAFRLECGDRAVTSDLLNGKKFEISIGFYSESSDECTDVEKEKVYSIFYPLPVYSLNSGVYEYAVNQIHTGYFELKDINAIPFSLLE